MATWLATRAHAGPSQRQVARTARLRKGKTAAEDLSCIECGMPALLWPVADGRRALRTPLLLAAKFPKTRGTHRVPTYALATNSPGLLPNVRGSFIEGTSYSRRTSVSHAPSLISRSPPLLLQPFPLRAAPSATPRWPVLAPPRAHPARASDQTLPPRVAPERTRRTPA